MPVFQSIQDEDVARHIRAATARVVYGAPGVSAPVADALVACIRSGLVPQIEIVLDGDEETCRLGYCDAPALERLHSAVTQGGMSILRHPGIRLGILLTDEEVLIWSPTPLMFEAPRGTAAPNGMVLTSKTLDALPDALGIGLRSSPDDAELGRSLMRREEVASVAEAIKSAPPAPFNLARLTRVFSSRFQFVETTLCGAELTRREIPLESLIGSSNVPEELEPLLGTSVQPFNIGAGRAIPVPVFVDGEQAFNHDGEPISRAAKQADIHSQWADLTRRYLVDLPGFGKIIRHTDKIRFEADRKAFEVVLKSWINGFRDVIDREHAGHVARVVDWIKARLDPPGAGSVLADATIAELVRRGFERLRATEPGVKVVYKNLAVESTRDEQFLQILRRHMPKEELKGWFHIFDAAFAVEFNNRPALPA